MRLQPRNGAAADAAAVAAASPELFVDLQAALQAPALSTVTSLVVALDETASPLLPGRSDLLAALVDDFPSLAHVTVMVRGICDRSLMPLVLDVCRQARQRGIGSVVELELDRETDAFAALDSRPGPTTMALTISRDLQREGVDVCWSVPLVTGMLHRLEPIFSLARDEGLDAMLSLPPQSATPAGLDADDRQFVWDFVAYRLLGEERSGLSAERLAYYEHLAAWLRHPTVRPPERRQADLRLAPEDGARWSLVVVPRAMQPDRPAPAPGQHEVEAGAHPLTEVAAVLWEGWRGLLQWALASLSRQRRTTVPGTTRLPAVLLIGAYGGEHIGDAAILGGVLFRLHRKYGTHRAVLVSQRPTHTRHLMPMLDVPVEISVENYEPAVLRRVVREVDAVVFAGGPLIDLPKQLVKHLYAASFARRLGKPFLAEGIGPGPFIRRPSAWVARRLVAMADHVTLRTASDAAAAVVRDIDVEVGRDPAFDYLQTRPQQLTRLPQTDAVDLEHLLQGTEHRLLIGLNVRPINHFFNPGSSDRERAEHTRAVEHAFERRLAEGLGRFRDDWGDAFTAVFFPMNAIQFGQSDLRSAYRIARHLPEGVDFRVWQGDPSLDAVVALLRRTDIAITMRFHASIFALSQGCRVVGIDYRIGHRDKVAALLDDFDKGEDCTRIDQLTPEWLVERLRLQAQPGIRKSGRAERDTSRGR